MKCPKCGYMRQARDDAFVPSTECPSCGIVYAKHDTIAAPKGPLVSVTPPPHLRPSAVDPESLRKARERVERRLRERMEVRTRDDKYEQTLELAKKITNESLHNSQNPFLRALEKKLENTPLDPSDNPDVATDDPVLLNEMVGVRIHSANDDTGSMKKDGQKAPEGQPPADPSEGTSTKPVSGTAELEAQAAKTDTVKAEVENAMADATDIESDEAEIDAAQSQAPEPEPEETDDVTYPEDVQVETVRLESQLENTDTDLMDDASPEQSTSESLSGDEEDDPPAAYIAAASTATRFAGKLTRLLPMVAWLILITGLVGSVLSWTTISDVEAGVNLTTGNNSASQLPLGLLLGFAYLATGALGFAFFWVSSAMNRQLKDIRQMLMLHQDVSESEPLPNTLED